MLIGLAFVIKIAIRGQIWKFWFIVAIMLKGILYMHLFGYLRIVVMSLGFCDSTWCNVWYYSQCNFGVDYDLLGHCLCYCGVDLAFELWVSCATELVICVLLDFLLVDSSLFSRCFSFGCLSLFFCFVWVEFLVCRLFRSWCAFMTFVVFGFGLPGLPVVLWFDLFWFAVYVGLVSFGLIWFIVVRIGLSICLCMVLLVRFGLI